MPAPRLAEGQTPRPVLLIELIATDFAVIDRDQSATSRPIYDKFGIAALVVDDLTR